MDRIQLEEMIMKIFKNATPDQKEIMFETLVMRLSSDDLKSVASSEVLR